MQTQPLTNANCDASASLRRWVTTSMVPRRMLFLLQMPPAFHLTRLWELSEGKRRRSSIWQRRLSDRKAAKERQARRGGWGGGSRSLAKWIAVGKGNFCVVRRGQESLKRFPPVLFQVHSSELWICCLWWLPAREIYVVSGVWPKEQLLL